MFKSTLSLAALTAVLTMVIVKADTMKPFDSQAFAKAQADGKTVVLDFHATWCPVCRVQTQTLFQVLKEDKFKNVVAFTADFDTEKDLEYKFKISAQSTLVVFKGGNEAARQTGITDQDSITGLVSKGL